MGETSTTVQATGTTLDILHALREMEGARIAELAERLDRAPSTVYRHLATLHDRHYVRKDGDEYHLALRFLELGGHAQTTQPGFDIAKEKVDQLAAETEERAQFIVEEHGYRFYLYTQTGEHAVQTDASIGKRGYLHASSSGKAILASMSRARVEEIIDRVGLPAVTDRTVTDPDELFAELDAIRERGYAINTGETMTGLNAIGTAIEGPEDEVIGSISVSGPANRLKGDRLRSELPDLLLGTVNEIELRLKYS
jgi:DNA-binding IclR family transcriptional regulator